jgi:hypothetical protein
LYCGDVNKDVNIDMFDAQLNYNEASAFQIEHNPIVVYSYLSSEIFVMKVVENNRVLFF